MRKIAIIGGTGVYSPDALGGFEEKVIKTPYGDALCKMGSLYGNQVVFITRHGAGHSVPPHKVNYRANIWALKSLGTEEIFATTAVGSLNKEMKAGHFVVCDQAIDFTKSRVNTFYDTPERGVVFMILRSAEWLMWILPIRTARACVQRLLNALKELIFHSIKQAVMSAPKARVLKLQQKLKCSPCWAATL